MTWQMDLPKKFSRRRGIVFYLQIAAAIISLIIGIATISKESAPVVERMQEIHRQALIQRHQEEAQAKALMISNMNLPWQFRGHDGTWRYYSDPTGRYWFRTNIEGVKEYSENPQFRLASNPRQFP